MRDITFSLTLVSLTLFEVANAFAATAKCDIRYRIFVNAFGGLARPPVRCGVCENHPVRCGVLTNIVARAPQEKQTRCICVFCLFFFTISQSGGDVCQHTKGVVAYANEKKEARWHTPTNKNRHGGICQPTQTDTVALALA